MPLFSRPDGDLIRDLHPTRRIMPYLMPRRGDAIIFYEQILDLTHTLPFIREWNENHSLPLTLFHVLIAACGKALLVRPGLNRFVSGGRIYQRRGVFISFVAKTSFDDEAPFRTVKIPIHHGDSLREIVGRVHEALSRAREKKERGIDKEIRWVTSLPAPILRLGVFSVRLLDRCNLLPKRFIEGDPMYTSLFLANLGSVGIDRVWHHLYEYGTASMFGVLGEIKKMLLVNEQGQPEVRDAVRVRFSFDERINDGFYCAASLDIMRAYVEDPTLFESQPEAPHWEDIHRGRGRVRACAF